MASWPEKQRGSITEQSARLFIKKHPKGRRMGFKQAIEDLREAVVYMETLCDELAMKRAWGDSERDRLKRKLNLEKTLTRDLVGEVELLRKIECQHVNHIEVLEKSIKDAVHVDEYIDEIERLQNQIEEMRAHNG